VLLNSHLVTTVLPAPPGELRKLSWCVFIVVRCSYYTWWCLLNSCREFSSRAMNV